MEYIKFIVGYASVFLSLEFILERKFHIKARITKRIGDVKRIILIFTIVIVSAILFSVLSIELQDNMWIRGGYLGFIVFGAESSKNTKISPRNTDEKDK